MEVGEQIESTSINLLVNSVLIEEQGLPINVAQILGGDHIIEDETSRIHLEDGLGQLNVLDLFTQEDIILESTKYITWQIYDREKLSPNIFMIKKNYDKSYLLNVLITPYSDINLSKARVEVEFMAQSFAGIFRRTQKQKENGLINDFEQIDELKLSANRLGGFYHWLIFGERSMRSGVETSVAETMLTSALLFNATLEHDETQCIGECGKTFNEIDHPIGSKCNCGGDLVKAPPYLKLKDVSFVFPDGISEIIGDENAALPTNILKLITNVIIPRGVSLALNRISPMNFSGQISMPNKALYRTQSTNDAIKISMETYQKSDNEILIFAAIADSRYTDKKLLSAMSLPVIMRDIISGIKEGYNWKSIIKHSVLKEWEVTPFIKLDTLVNFQRLEDMRDIYAVSDAEEETKIDIQPTEEAIQEEVIPEETVPEETVPEEVIPEEAIPEEAIPEETVPEEAIPEEAIPEEAIPEEAIPEEAVPEEAVPEEAVPEEAVPEEVIPEEAIPEEAVPEEAIPEEAIPEEAIPEEAIPEETVPEEIDQEENLTSAFSTFVYGSRTRKLTEQEEMKEEEEEEADSGASDGNE